MLQVDHDDKQNAALKAFNELWKSKFAEDSLLVFSTGRSLALYNELRVCSKFSSVRLISGLLCHVRLQRCPCTAAACVQTGIDCRAYIALRGGLGNPDVQCPHHKCCVPAAETVLGTTCRKRCPLACQTCWCAQ